MTIRAAYSDWAATYDLDRNRTRDLDERITRNALANLHCKSVLEIGCGTGKNTSMLAEISEWVCALDFSREMIEQAREKVSQDNVSFIVADLTTGWPCRAGTFDLITCNLVLEHIRSLDFVYEEAARVLVKGGRFFICELHPFRQYQGVRANFQRDDKTTEIDAFVHHVTDFIDAAATNGLSLEAVKEWWHEDDQHKLPRLISFMFQK